MATSYLELIFLLPSLLIQLVPLTVAQSYFPREECISERRKYTGDSTYQADLNSLLTSFSNTQVEYGFYNSSAGEVNGIGLCRGDLSPDKCCSCINNSRQELRRLCPNYKEAILYDDLCMLRYSDRPIFGTEETSPHYAVADIQNVSDLESFREQLQNMLLDLRGKAASGGSLRKYATGEALTTNSDTAYALVQCTPDLEDQECRDRLDVLGGLVSDFFKNKQGGHAKAPGCNFRFQTYRFYDPLYGAPTPSYASPPPPKDAATGEGKSNSTQTIIIVVILTVVSVILISCICLFLRMRKPRDKDEMDIWPLNMQCMGTSRLS